MAIFCVTVSLCYFFIPDPFPFRERSEILDVTKVELTMASTVERLWKLPRFRSVVVRTRAER